MELEQAAMRHARAMPEPVWVRAAELCSPSRVRAEVSAWVPGARAVTRRAVQA